jgi:hypothetical protein
MGDFALPNPSTKGRACPLDPSRLQRGKGAFLLPLDPMTKAYSTLRPSQCFRRLDVRALQNALGQAFGTTCPHEESHCFRDARLTTLARIIFMIHARKMRYHPPLEGDNA